MKAEVKLLKSKFSFPDNPADTLPLQSLPALWVVELTTFEAELQLPTGWTKELSKLFHIKLLVLLKADSSKENSNTS